jgi:hypothetical protein
MEPYRTDARAANEKLRANATTDEQRRIAEGMSSATAIEASAQVRMMLDIGDGEARLPSEARRSSTALDSALEYLRSALRTGPQDGAKVIGSWNGAERTLYRAKKQLGVIEERSGRGRQARSMWRLPARRVSRTRRSRRNRP